MPKNVELSEAMLAAILKTAVDPIIMINERGIIESANHATEDVFGYRLAELIGQNIKLLMPAPYQDEHDGYLNRYLTSGKANIIGIGRETIGKRKDGNTFPIELAVSEARVGKRIFFTGIIRDITDRKKSEQTLAQLNEELQQRVKSQTQELHTAQELLLLKEKMALLGQVSGGISHEIKNPLNTIKTSAYFLLNANDLPMEKIREHLERIERQVNLAENVITALSKFAKLPEPEFRAVAVRSCFLESLASITIPSNIIVEIDMPTDSLHMQVDEGLMMIVFRNLISNARDAMPDGGKLKLSVEETGDHVYITTEDTGAGIPAAILDRVTNPLFTTKPLGMGLGLAISRAIVEQHRGELEVTSEIGAGTRIIIKLKSSNDIPA
jgi:two-component system sensor kinase FixL